MRVVDAEEFDAAAANGHRPRRVVQAEPAQLVFEELLHLGDVEFGLGVFVRTRAREIPQWVLRGRSVVVVRAIDEDARDAPEGLQRIRNTRQPIFMTHVVARVDHQVGFEHLEGTHPVLLVRLPRRHVQVGEVQHGQRARTGLEDRQGLLTHLVARTLHQRAIGERRKACRGDNAQRGRGDFDGMRH